MRFDRAIQYIGPHDCRAISQTWLGARLEVPFSLIPAHQESLRLILPPESRTIGEIALPTFPLDVQAVERLLWEAGFPPTGWVPGYEHFQPSSYKPDILFAILFSARQMVQESNRATIALDELRARVGLKDRTFLMHFYHLIEDGQGLIALDEQTVRLATWREAIQTSARIIASMKNHHTKGDVILPECKLALTESSTLCDWMIVSHSDRPFSFFSLHPSSDASLRGDEVALDLYIKEQMLPDGWAATYGDNETENLRMEEAFANSGQERKN